VVYKTPQRDIHALLNVDFDIDTAETVAVVGESGCGKSTLGFSVMRLLPRNAYIAGGSITFQSTDITKLQTKELGRVRWEKISMIPQNAQNALDPTQRVGSQVVEGILAHRKISRRAAAETTISLFKGVGLAQERLRNYPHELSGGSRQRVMIGMALALNPVLLIADEPTTGLDVAVQLQILELLKTIKRQTGLSIIFITHDLGVARYISDRITVMYAGQVVEESATKALFDNPLHPYTMALKDNILPLTRKQRRDPVAGTPPTLEEIKTRCPFADRCVFAKQICMDEDPPLIKIDEGSSKCFFAKEFRRSKGCL
jgi:oligopeptide/dipeptide ABC transporter ATP-binding protein